ncbi:ECF transporter S component [Lactiplantibacillus garii]|uniref:ECF transporter S component n=1 Tax=Lactiplantibacillus garii TaxID=2306423 RepID=A0A426D493_9LACO|nr:ECF transporter S component [Lactiplantibacillus garii]RRK09426.1 ECF transporter S component [Lactiplantibacillus garii]
MVKLTDGNQHKITTKTVTTLGILIAVTVVISLFFHIPVPMTHGYINLCDAGIFIAALLFGRRGGAIVGGASGLLLDLLLGYSQYMIFSLIVHGLEGWIAGQFGAGRRKGQQVVALAVACVVMVGGYFISDSIMYTIQTGLVGIPTNFVQAVVGGLIAFPVVARVKRHVKTEFNA